MQTETLRPARDLIHGITVFFSAKQETRVKIDIVLIGWWFIASFWFVTLQTWVDQDMAIAVKGLIGSTFMILGIIYMGFIVGMNMDRLFSLDEFVNEGAIPILTGLVGAIAWNLAVTRSFTSGSAVPIGSATFAILMGGVGESTLIQGALLPTIKGLFGDDLMAVLVSSGVGALLHSVIYGADPVSILAVFGSFIAFGLAFVWSHYRLSVPVTIHATFNLLVYLR